MCVDGFGFNESEQTRYFMVRIVFMSSFTLSSSMSCLFWVVSLIKLENFLFVIRESLINICLSVCVCVCVQI